MDSEKSLREHLIYLLKDGGAHANFESAVTGLRPTLRSKRPAGAAHSPWEVLEHMRIAQEDILEYIRNPKYVSPEFPAGYWPKTPAPPTEQTWDKSIAGFRADSDAVVKLVEDPATDLFARIRPDEQHTILREILLVADHNAYHVGELILLRRLLGAWK
jgi:hypothetical protein